VGFGLQGFFLNDCWKNKEIVRRFKGNDTNAEC